MTLVRIIALSLLLGIAVAGVVWFTWGAVVGLKRGRQSVPAEATSKESKESKKEPVPATGKSA